jgi:hypothetical protein
LPWDFWQMTPAELQLRVEAFERAEKTAWERTAWMVSHLMSAWVGDKAPSPDELLGYVKDA